MLPNGPLGGGLPSRGDVPEPRKPGESPLGGKKIKETTGEAISQRSRSVHGYNTYYAEDARKIADYLGLKCTKAEARVFLDRAREHPGEKVPFNMPDGGNGSVSWDAKTHAFYVEKGKHKPGEQKYF